jgi:hypothetical protein
MNIITVPARLVGVLRSGLHSEIGNAAKAIAQVAGRAGREQHPESYRETLERLDRTRALLDLIGWSATGPAVAVRVELPAHRETMLDGLAVAMVIGDGDLEEAARVDAERAARGEAPIREATTQRVLALCEFRAAVEAYADDPREPQQ